LNEVNLVNEVNGMNGSGRQEFDNIEDSAGKYDENKCQTRGVISWGEREYAVDEFRSLLMAETDAKKKNMIVLEALRQTVTELERNIQVTDKADRVADGCKFLLDSPECTVNETDKNYDRQRR